MAYSFEQVFAADPANPSNIAQNASITIFAPGDGTMTPIAITDPDGQPLSNPIPVNANGFGSAFMADIDRVAWAGGGFTGFFTSYEGIKQIAVAAQTAAETAATTAGTAASNASASATAAANSAALVGAPADTAIAAAINGTGATKTALNAAYASKADTIPVWKPTTTYIAGQQVISPAGDIVSAVANFTSGASFAAANWSYVRMNDYFVNVKSFGAKGDGVTLDTADIRAAYAACPAGHVLYFPAGTYLSAADGVYGPALNVTRAITITGAPGAVIKASGTAPVGTRLIQVNGNDVSIHGLSFDTNNIDSATCVFAYGAARLKVKDSYFIDPGSGGLLINDNVTDVLFTGNKVTGGGYGVLVNDNPGNARLTFSHNNFNGNNQPGDGIEINGVANVIYDVVSIGNVISNYTSTNASVGFGIAYANVTRGTISGNIITNCGRNGIHIECLSKRVTVANNTVSDCLHAGIEVQGEFGKACQIITIANNSVSNCCITPSVNLGRGGIEVGSSTGAPFTGFGAVGVKVTGNTVDGSRGAGIYLWQMNNSLVDDNLVINTYGVSTDNVNAINNVGIHSVSSINTLFSNNRVVDTQGTKTQHYPMHFYGDATGVITMGNHLKGNIANSYDMTTGVTRVLDTDDGIIRVSGVGQLGFFGSAGTTKQTLPAAASDAATTQALVNAIRSMMIGHGMVN